eukprot:6990291-Prymnesium_polylepis.1
MGDTVARRTRRARWQRQQRRRRRRRRMGCGGSSVVAAAVRRCGRAHGPEEHADVQAEEVHVIVEAVVGADRSDEAR